MASPPSITLGDVVVGIDVGARQKGFHAVALRGKAFVAMTTATDPPAIVRWCIEQKAIIVAVDSPCGWSKEGGSREAERDLNVGGQTIQCFKTPTRKRARENASGFYDWVFNGEKLYNNLALHYPLFNGKWQNGPVCIETFPNAVVCALAGRVVPARPKVATRRRTLREAGLDGTVLPNVDFVDAALCALTAEAFRNNQCQCLGNNEEGWIVLPRGEFQIRRLRKVNDAN